MNPDPTQQDQIEDETAIHLLVEGEVEIVQRLLRIAELRLFASAFQQPRAAPVQFVRNQASLWPRRQDGRPALS